MSGGLWGCTKGSLSNVMELIASFPTDSNYLTDMNFLNKLVWPIAMKDVLQHDAWADDDQHAWVELQRSINKLDSLQTLRPKRWVQANHEV